MNFFFKNWVFRRLLALVQLEGVCWGDRMIIATLFFYFLSYPFAIRNLMGVIYPLLLNVLLVATVLTCAVGRAPILVVRFLYSDRVLVAGIFLYSLYFAILMMVSLLNSSDSVVAVSAVYELRESLFALTIFFLLSNQSIIIALRLYVEIFTWCSIFGLLLVLLNFAGVIQPITEVSLDNFPGGGANTRLFFGIGFIWPNTWLGSVVGLERLQSFADEAGTFAFAVLPAILLATLWRMKVRVFVMTVALIFTFSVGAIFIWFLIMLLGFAASVVQDGMKAKRIFVVLLLFAALILFASFFPFDLFEQVDRYFSAKYTSDGGDGTSIGQRLAGLEIALDAIREYPVGFGVNSAGISLDLGGASLAIGWFIPLVEAGVIGWLIYVFSFGLVLAHALKNAIYATNMKRVCAVVILINGYAAFQRAGIDANVWQLFWLVTYLRVIGMNADELAGFDPITNRKLGRISTKAVGG